MPRYSEHGSKSSDSRPHRNVRGSCSTKLSTSSFLPPERSFLRGVVALPHFAGVHDSGPAPDRHRMKNLPCFKLDGGLELGDRHVRQAKVFDVHQLARQAGVTIVRPGELAARSSRRHRLHRPSVNRLSGTVAYVFRSNDAPQPQPKVVADDFKLKQLDAVKTEVDSDRLSLCARDPDHSMRLHARTGDAASVRTFRR